MTATETRLVTIEDLEQLEDDAQRYDLIRGELIRMPPAGGRHGRLEMRLGSAMLVFATDLGLGEVYGAETGFVLARNPDVLLAPDVAFIRADRMPPEDEEIGFLRVVPDLVVEVVSPSDRARHVSDKVMEYLDAGVRLAWVVEPRRRIVTVYSADRSARVLTLGDVLDGGDVLPGFKLPLAELFR